MSKNAISNSFRKFSENIKNNGKINKFKPNKRTQFREVHS